MGLNPQVIGKEMPHGFAGCYARQPDMIVNTRPAGGDAAIPFGAALKYEDGAVIPMGAAATAAEFVGVAGCEIKSALTYLDQSQGQYAVGEPVSVFQRGASTSSAAGAPPPWVARCTCVSPQTAAIPPPLWAVSRPRRTAPTPCSSPTASGRAPPTPTASPSCAS